MKVNLISVDMFQTLADIASLKYVIWERILGPDYTRDLADQYWRRASGFILAYLTDPGFEDFEPIQVVFEKSYTRLLAEIPHQFDPKTAAEIMRGHHPLCQLFDDAMPFFNEVSQVAPVCLSSDTDDLMMGPLTGMFPFDQVFTSEELKAYKVQNNRRFFQTILDFYGIPAHTVLHIGDSPSDVIGARQSGMKSCWINRDNREWTHDIGPDYTVRRLDEIIKIITDIQ